MLDVFIAHPLAVVCLVINPRGTPAAGAEVIADPKHDLVEIAAIERRGKAPLQYFDALIAVWFRSGNFGETTGCGGRE